MKTIKIIELLNKIANGEVVPKQIKYNGYIYNYRSDNEDYDKYKEYECEFLFSKSFTYRNDISAFLNEEIEIIEDDDKKIEKIPHLFYDEENGEMNSLELFMIQNQHAMISKMNELIDYINREN